MSLINDALKDLEGRQAASDLVLEKHTGNNFESTASRTPMVLGGIICLSIGFGVALMFGNEPATTNQISVPSAEVSTRIVPLAQSAEAALTRTLDRGDGISSVTEVESEVLQELDLSAATPNIQEQVVQLLLEDAEIAFLAGRLTTPRTTSAYWLFGQVLQIAPDNALANSGIARIKNRYLKLIDSSIEKNQFEKANLYIHRLSNLLTASDDVGQSVELALKVSDLRSRERLVAEREGQEQQTAHSVEQRGKENLEINAAELRQQQTIKKSVTQRRIDVLVRVDNEIRDGNIHNALLILEESRREFDVFDVALATRLVDLYIDTSQLQDAEALIVERELVDERFTYQRAMLLQETSGVESAFNYLKHQPDLAPAAQEKLASLYYKNKYYTESLILYKSLVVTDEHNSVFWLGYAVSADGLNKHDEAFRAYRVAYALGGHEQNVQDFISQRIKILQAGDTQPVELTQW